MASTPTPHSRLARAQAIGAALVAFPAADGGPPVPPAALARWKSAAARLAADSAAGAGDPTGTAAAAAADPRLVIALSDVGVRLRALEGIGGGSNDGARPARPVSSSASFVRASKKFIVAPGREAEVAVALASRLPISLVGDRPPLAPPPGWSPVVTSVYVDCPGAGFPVHAARSARADGAALTRLRWYGGGGGTAWVETKTHRKPTGGAAASTPSSKDRVRVCPATAAALLDPGAPCPPGLPALAAALAAAVRGPPSLAPVLATQACRLAFEARGVRVTMDEGLVFYGGPAVDLRGWVGAGGVVPPAGRHPPSSSSFPFAVLEVKTPLRPDGTPQPPPVWLAALVGDPDIAAYAPRYSKYLSGAVALYAPSHPGLLSTVGCVALTGGGSGGGGDDGDSATSVGAAAPLSPGGASMAAKEEVGDEAGSRPPPPPAHPRRGLFAWHRARRARGLAAAASATRLLRPSPRVHSSPTSAPSSSPTWPPRRPAAAKTFFANERTFLAWLQVAVLLLLLGVSLLGGPARGTEVVLGDRGGGSGAPVAPPTSPAAKASLIAGGVVAPAAVCFLGYAFAVFRRRAARLAWGGAGGLGRRGEEEGYSDARGAAALAALALLAGVATLAAGFAKVGAGV